MLKFLFPRLTAARDDGGAAFAAAVRIARSPDFYADGGVADTLDGRFAVLSTVTALLLVRLERDGPAGDALSVAVTEAFVAAMEAEHRELGLGDPALGKTVRMLVGALAKRLDQWRSAVSGERAWAAATQTSLYRAPADPGSVGQAEILLRAIWNDLDRADLDAIRLGEWS